MPDKATTVRLDHRTLKRLDGIARATSHSRSSAINEAVAHYLEYEKWFVGAVKQGLKQVETGDLVEHETIMRVWERRRGAIVDVRR